MLNPRQTEILKANLFASPPNLDDRSRNVAFDAVAFPHLYRALESDGVLVLFDALDPRNHSGSYRGECWVRPDPQPISPHVLRDLLQRRLDRYEATLDRKPEDPHPSAVVLALDLLDQGFDVPARTIPGDRARYHVEIQGRTVQFWYPPAPAGTDYGRFLAVRSAMNSHAGPGEFDANADFYERNIEGAWMRVPPEGVRIALHHCGQMHGQNERDRLGRLDRFARESSVVVDVGADVSAAKDAIGKFASLKDAMGRSLDRFNAEYDSWADMLQPLYHDPATDPEGWLAFSYPGARSMFRVRGEAVQRRVEGEFPWGTVAYVDEGEGRAREEGRFAWNLHEIRSVIATPTLDPRLPVEARDAIVREMRRIVAGVQAEREAYRREIVEAALRRGLASETNHGVPPALTRKAVEIGTPLIPSGPRSPDVEAAIEEARALHGESVVGWVDVLLLDEAEVRTLAKEMRAGKAEATFSVSLPDGRTVNLGTFDVMPGGELRSRPKTPTLDFSDQEIADLRGYKSPIVDALLPKEAEPTPFPVGARVTRIGATTVPYDVLAIDDLYPGMRRIGRVNGERVSNVSAWVSVDRLLPWVEPRPARIKGGPVRYLPDGRLARVQSETGSHGAIRIRFEDGTSARVEERLVEILSFGPGDRVRVRRKGGRRATVLYGHPTDRSLYLVKLDGASGDTRVRILDLTPLDPGEEAVVRLTGFDLRLPTTRATGGRVEFGVPLLFGKGERKEIFIPDALGRVQAPRAPIVEGPVADREPSVDECVYFDGRISNA